MVHRGSEQGRLLLFLPSAPAGGGGSKTGSTESGSESIGSGYYAIGGSGSAPGVFVSQSASTPAAGPLPDLNPSF